MHVSVSMDSVCETCNKNMRAKPHIDESMASSSSEEESHPSNGTQDRDLVRFQNVQDPAIMNDCVSDHPNYISPSSSTSTSLTPSSSNSSLSTALPTLHPLHTLHPSPIMPSSSSSSPPSSNSSSSSSSSCPSSTSSLPPTNYFPSSTAPTPFSPHSAPFGTKVKTVPAKLLANEEEHNLDSMSNGLRGTTLLLSCESGVTQVSCGKDKDNNNSDNQINQITKNSHEIDNGDINIDGRNFVGNDSHKNGTNNNDDSSMNNNSNISDINKINHDDKMNCENDNINVTNIAIDIDNDIYLIKNGKSESKGRGYDNHQSDCHGNLDGKLDHLKSHNVDSVSSYHDIVNTDAVRSTTHNQTEISPSSVVVSLPSSSPFLPISSIAVSSPFPHSHFHSHSLPLSPSAPLSTPSSVTSPALSLPLTLPLPISTQSLNPPSPSYCISNPSNLPPSLSHSLSPSPFTPTSLTPTSTPNLNQAKTSSAAKSHKLSDFSPLQSPRTI